MEDGGIQCALRCVTVFVAERHGMVGGKIDVQENEGWWHGWIRELYL